MRNPALLAASMPALFFAGHVLAVSLEAEVRDRAGQPVAEAVVYAMPASGPVDARARKTVAIEQADREFVPYVSVIQSGTAVTFPNRDPILHHVYSFSPAKTFEIKLYGGKSPTEVLFDKPGVITLGCNIHDWMIGYILVVATPHFARSDAHGSAVIRDVPPGSYVLMVWHPQQVAAPAPQPIALTGNARARFEIEVQPRKTRYKPPLDRLKY